MDMPHISDFLGPASLFQATWFIKYCSGELPSSKYIIRKLDFHLKLNQGFLPKTSPSGEISAPKNRLKRISLTESQHVSLFNDDLCYVFVEVVRKRGCEWQLFGQKLIRWSKTLLKKDGQKVWIRFQDLNGPSNRFIRKMRKSFFFSRKSDRVKSSDFERVKSDSTSFQCLVVCPSIWPWKPTYNVSFSFCKASTCFLRRTITSLEAAASSLDAW